MFDSFKKILVLAPHTDDGELGCGGTIARFLEEGKEIYYIAFSIARSSLKNEFPENILEIEVKKASSVLGIKPENLKTYDYPVRLFPQNRQKILEELVKIRNEINPDLVLTPSLNDIHQDHQTLVQETLRAFKKQTVLGYEEPWNNIVFETRCFVPLERRHIEKKVEALECYQSQKHRSYLNQEFIWSLAKTRGVQIEGNYAEAFEVLRWIL